jgi:hypothetical protein
MNHNTTNLTNVITISFFWSHPSGLSLKDFDPLNAELNPIYHLLILLGNLTFMGPCIVSIFQYISNKMQRYTVYLYLETALHVSGSTSTHHQERIQLYLQNLVLITPLLLSAAIVEVLEPVWVCCGCRTRRWNYHPKHVELFPDINKLCNVASFWIYECIELLLGAHPNFHISRLRVNIFILEKKTDIKTLFVRSRRSRVCSDSRVLAKWLLKLIR